MNYRPGGIKRNLMGDLSDLIIAAHYYMNIALEFLSAASAPSSLNHKVIGIMALAPNALAAISTPELI